MNDLNVVILAGGKGTRLAEETTIKPKPMVKIGKLPIISHIIEIYKGYGFKNFYIAAGYKHELINKYFKKKVHKNITVKVFNTGINTQTGGRIFKLKRHLQNKRFLLTYGDGLSDVNINKLLNFHLKNKKEITITAIQPPPRWGFLKIEGNIIKKFEEKNKSNEGWINGGFMVLEPSIFKNYKFNNHTVLENDILTEAAKNRKLGALKHFGYWQCMDTLRDKITLNQQVKKGGGPWKIT